MGGILIKCYVWNCHWLHASLGDVRRWADVWCDWLYGDGNVAVASLAFCCNPRAGVSDSLKIYSSVWNQKIRCIMAVGTLIMNILILTSKVRCEENVNEQVHMWKVSAGQKQYKNNAEIVQLTAVFFRSLLVAKVTALSYIGFGPSAQVSASVIRRCYVWVFNASKSQ